MKISKMKTDNDPAATFQKQVADNIRKIGEDSAFQRVPSRKTSLYVYKRTTCR